MRNPVYYRSLILLLFLILPSLAQAATYPREGDIIGTITQYKVKPHDTLPSIARQFDIGMVEVLAANPKVTPKLLKAGTTLQLPTMHVLPAVQTGLVINLSELRLFYFPNATQIITFPIGIGKEGWKTPTGITTITRKRKDPTWAPPFSIRAENPNLPDVVPAGPDNPLGQYALNLGIPGYLIHGTNKPGSIGKRTSHGCIRLYPEDIKVLFELVDKDTPVTIIDKNFKLGWRGNLLYLEVTPTQEQSDSIAAYRLVQITSSTDVEMAIHLMEASEIDWYVALKTITEPSGLPVVIGKR